MFDSYFEVTSESILCEDDVRRLFLSQAKNLPNWHRPVLKTVNFLVNLVVIFAIVFTAINAPALWLKLSYSVQNTAFPMPVTRVATNPVLPSPAAQQAPPAAAAASTMSLPDNRLIIKKINLNVPINWDVTNQNQTVMTSLESGVAQIKGTAKPGQAGNIFIVGHSSNYIWAAGNYKEVFALLSNLSVDDQIIITYQGQEYSYTVDHLETVSPSDVSVMNLGDQPELSLMTCTPVGTDLNRLIVIAKPDNPAASSQPVPTNNASNSTSLPLAQ